MLSTTAGAAASHAKPSQAAGHKQAASSLPTGTCDWAPGDNTPMNDSQADNLRYGYVNAPVDWSAFA